MPPTTVPVHYQWPEDPATGPDQYAKPPETGPLMTTDCPECLLLVSTGNLQAHRERAHAYPAQHPPEPGPESPSQFGR